MGSLTLPNGGRVAIDANVLIYTVQGHPTYSPVIAPMWASVAAGSLTVIGSELLILETLIVPIRANDQARIHAYEQVFANPDIVLTPVSIRVLREAARLRAAIQGLRTPDAIHAATAIDSAADLFITNDRGFKRVTGLNVVILDDVFAAP